MGASLYTAVEATAQSRRAAALERLGVKA